MKRQKIQLPWKNLQWNSLEEKETQKSSQLLGHQDRVSGSSHTPTGLLGHRSLKDGWGNLLELILWVISYWPRLDGNHLTFRLTLFPGAISGGRRRFLSLLFPEELLKCLKLGFFLSYAERLHVVTCWARVRCAPCIHYLLLGSPFSTQKYVKYTDNCFCTSEKIDPTTLWSWPEPRSGVGCLNNWATWTPSHASFFNCWVTVYCTNKSKFLYLKYTELKAKRPGEVKAMC